VPAPGLRGTRAAPLGRDILPDDYRRAAVPFVFSEA
jgi:hypothetical protein